MTSIEILDTAYRLKDYYVNMMDAIEDLEETEAKEALGDLLREALEARFRIENEGIK